MKDYLKNIKDIVYPLYKNLRNDKELVERLIIAHPELEERLKVLKWNFVRITFKYQIIGKLDYGIDALRDIEEFYDEIFDIYQYKFTESVIKAKKPKANEEYKTENGNETYMESI